MEIGSILLVFAVFVPVVIYIARPLIERKASNITAAEHTLSQLLAEHDRNLNALQELDFDYSLGKIPEEDYPPTRAWLVQQGVEILRKLDEIQPATAAFKAEDRIEAAIASRRLAAGVSGNGHGAVKHPDDNIETLIAARRRGKNGKAAGFCHKCGGAVQKTDQFCPKCGASLKAVA